MSDEITAEVVEEREEPQTPREALLMIRARIARVAESSSMLMEIDELVTEGLAGNGGFALSDTLADRLGEAHAVLGEIKRCFEPETAHDREIMEQVSAALTLPPALEAIVDRRIGPA